MNKKKTENEKDTLPEDNLNDVPDEKDSGEAIPDDEKSAATDELGELKDKYLRLAAEYDNFRKRSQKERETLYIDIKARTAEQFLPVFDNLERALSVQTEDKAYYKGVTMIMTQFDDILKKLGITRIEAEGKTFDPNLHNAVMQIEDENLEKNIVAEVFQQGFMLGDRVLRHATVKVANTL